MSTTPQYVYLFGRERTDGTAAMKNLLGGKGANLAEMCRLGITVPPGFTLTTEACAVYTQQGRDAALALIEAEEAKLTQANVDKMKAESKDPAVQRLLGVTEDTGKLLGLDKEWAYRIV